MNYIVVEGNVGVGKNKFINFLEESFSNINKYNYSPLDPIWSNPYDRAFTNGCSFILDRSKKIKLVGNYLINKCHLTFPGYVEASYRTNFLDLNKYNILNTLFTKLKYPKINYLILLKSDPGYCYEKLIENKINNSNPIFINEMGKVYNDLIKNLPPTIKLLVIDIEEYNIDTENGKSEILYLISNFLPFLTIEKDVSEWKTIHRKKRNKNARSFNLNK